MEKKNKSETKNGRRDFLSLLSFGIFAGMIGTVAISAFRFLRPAAVKAREEKWFDVAPIAELKGNQPITYSVMVEKKSGWANKTEEEFVFVLPQNQNQVLSSVCPHEGCQVVWRDESKQFVCPCHDSFFAPDGKKLTGPSQRDLDPLPTRTKDGVLQIQYVAYEAHTKERIERT
jgi:Rieske Fe-S protein